MQVEPARGLTKEKRPCDTPAVPFAGSPESSAPRRRPGPRPPGRSPVTGRPQHAEPGAPGLLQRPCEHTGNQIICTLAFTTRRRLRRAVGIICGSTELLFSQQRAVVGKRFYDADGNLLVRHFIETFTALHQPGHGQGRDVDPARHRDRRLTCRGTVATGTTRLSGLVTHVRGAGRRHDPHRRRDVPDRRVGSGESLHQRADTPSTTTSPSVTRRARRDSATRSTDPHRPPTAGHERWGASAPAVQPRELLERHPASLEAG